MVVVVIVRVEVILVVVIITIVVILIIIIIVIVIAITDQVVRRSQALVHELKVITFGRPNPDTSSRRAMALLQRCTRLPGIKLRRTLINTYHPLTCHRKVG